MTKLIMRGTGKKEKKGKKRKKRKKKKEEIKGETVHE
jgi:hypothetical protein